jgi:hypothetical protein
MRIMAQHLPCPRTGAGKPDLTFSVPDHRFADSAGGTGPPSNAECDRRAQRGKRQRGRTMAPGKVSPTLAYEGADGRAAPRQSLQCRSLHCRNRWKPTPSSSSSIPGEVW